FHGCFCAYQVLCSRLGIQANHEIVRGIKRSSQLVLDLGVKIDPPVSEEFTLVDFKRHARRVAANSIVNYKEKHRLENDAGFHIGSNVVFVNHDPGVANKSVVLFGDSFAEYRPHLLTGMLAETFREVHFVWTTSIDWSYVER